MTPDHLMTVQPELDALTAALKENGIDLPAHARTTVRVHDLATVIGAVHILAGAVRTEAEAHTCPVCKGTRVAYETGLFWSEAHPCTACAPVTDAPMLRGWKVAGASWQQVATDLIAMLDLRALHTEYWTGFSAKSLQKLDADIEEAKAVLSEMAEAMPGASPQHQPAAVWVPGHITAFAEATAATINQVYDLIQRTTARLGCTEEVARQIITGKPEAGQ